MESYSDGAGVPHAISCGHIFCRPCLVQVQPHCPLCRHRFDLSNTRKLHVSDAGSTTPVDPSMLRLWKDILNAARKTASFEEMERVIDQCEILSNAQRKRLTPKRMGVRRDLTPIMPDSDAIISVYAQFPKDPTRIQEEAYISEPTSWEWLQCLEIPVGVFNRLSFWPKHNQWIRYAMSAILGAQGHLSNAVNDDTPVDYDLELLPTKSTALYYHTPVEQKRHQFPVDPELNNARVLTSSSQSDASRQEDFRDDVIDRDGSCVLLGENARYCDAAHLLPHNKGNDYVEAATRRRGGPVIDDIDDVRNGLLLSKTLHSKFGISVLAFLRLPNFAMDNLAPQCIAHSFNPLEPFFGVTADGHIVKSGSAARMSQANWPPDCLFDTIYGSAVLGLFGVKASYEDALKGWKNELYVGDASQRAREKDQNAKRTREANNARNKRHRNRASEGPAPPDMLDAMFFFQTGRLPLYLSPMRQREAEERQLAEMQKQAREKVAEWRGRLAQ